MPNPIPGKTYTVQAGDTLSDIASRAYGSPAERVRIIEANGIANPDLIVVGQSLVIPPIAEIDALTRQFSIKDKGFRLKLGNRVLPVLAGRVLRTMDTPADGWSAVIAWEPGKDKELDELTKPFAFPDASVYLNGELMVSGRLYNVKNKFNNDGCIKELEGFSYTIDIVDSHVFPPYQYQNFTLLDFCKELFKILGLSIVIDAGIDVEGQFKEEKVNPTETIFKFLQRLADKRSALLSSTREGDLLITRANITSSIIGAIEEGQTAIGSWEGNFKGRNFFRTYRGILKKQATSSNKTAVLTDDNVPMQRIRTFQITEGDEKDLSDAVRWKRNRDLADSMSISLPIDTWNAYGDQLWQENTLMLVKSPTMQVPDGFVFLLRRVEFISDDQGETARLDFIPPSFYTKKEPVLPWLEKSISVGFEDLKTASNQ